MKERELEARVMRFLSHMGIAPESKVRTVVFDLTSAAVVVRTDAATYSAPATGLWSDYVDNVARIRPRLVPLTKHPDGPTEPGTLASGTYPGWRRTG